MKTRSQSRASSSDSIGRCFFGSIRGIANSFIGTRNRVPRYVTSNHTCSKQRRGFVHVRLLHLRQMAIAISFLFLLWLSSLRDSGRRASPNPIDHVGGMKPPSSDAEPLRDEQPAQVRAPHRLFMAADELSHLERGHQPVG